MALRQRTSRRRSAGESLRRAWVAAAGGPPPGVSARLHEAADDLARAAEGRRDDLKGAVSRFGWQAGNDGWPLSEVARWVEALAEVGGNRARELLTFDQGMALAAGWADGFLHGAHQADCVDPTTGLAQFGVLQLRVHQAYEQCGALGIEPDLAYILVIVDAGLHEHPTFERNAARVALADQTKSLFNTGETVAVQADRLFILASRTPDLADRVTLLDAALRTHPLLRHDHISIWEEQLPGAPERVARFLQDVTA